MNSPIVVESFYNVIRIKEKSKDGISGRKILVFSDANLKHFVESVAACEDAMTRVTMGTISNSRAKNLNTLDFELECRDRTIGTIKIMGDFVNRATIEAVKNADMLVFSYNNESMMKKTKFILDHISSMFLDVTPEIRHLAESILKSDNDAYAKFDTDFGKVILPVKFMRSTDPYFQK